MIHFKGSNSPLFVQGGDVEAGFCSVMTLDGENCQGREIRLMTATNGIMEIVEAIDAANLKSAEEIRAEQREWQDTAQSGKGE